MREILVIGAARSGTKVLRDSLATALDLGVVPYDIPFVWRSDVDLPHDAFGPDALTPEQVRYIRGFVQKYGLGRRGVVEKTVGNTLRVPAVHAVFPDALYVNLTRNGVDVLASAMREWQAPTDYRYVVRKLRHVPLRRAARYGLRYLSTETRRSRGGDDTPVWGPLYPGIQGDARTLPLSTVCARQWASCVATAERGFEETPARRVDVCYEDFVARPAENLARIAEAAGLPADPTRVATAAAVVRRPDGAARPRLRLPPEQVAMAAEAMDPELARLGYPLVRDSVVTEPRADADADA